MRVEDVDYRGQRPRQLLAVARQRLSGRGLAALGGGLQLAGVQPQAAAGGPAGAAEKGLDAVVQAGGELNGVPAGGAGYGGKLNDFTAAGADGSGGVGGIYFVQD